MYQISPPGVLPPKQWHVQGLIWGRAEGAMPLSHAEIWGGGILAFARRPPNKLVKRRFLCCAFISIFKIKIPSCNYHVYLRHLWCPFCPINVSYYHNIVFRIIIAPKYVLKMLRYDHGEIVLATHTKGR